MPDKAAKRRDVVCVTGLLLCFFILLLLNSFSTSPLFPNVYGNDASIFMLVGKGLANGKALYTDLFDHKGPFIFFINALGEMLGGRGGLFAFQTVSGFVTLLCLYRTAKIFRAGEKKFPLADFIIVAAAGFIMFLRTYENGDMTEEYSLPFIAVSLWLLAKYAAGAEASPDHPPKYAFVYGVCFAVLAFIRLNNAASIGAGILAVLVYLIFKKRYKNLGLNLLFGLIGIAAVTIPVLIYFYAESSMDEMIYATFLHNFKIAGNTGHSSPLSAPTMYIALYLPMVICAVLAASEICRTRKFTFLDALLCFTLAVNIASLWVANRFSHYFAVFVPVYAVFLLRYLRAGKQKLILALICVCMLVQAKNVVMFEASIVRETYINKSWDYESNVIKSDFDRIPDSERGSVIGYKISPRYYLYGDIIPCYKYYTLQDTWAITTPNILTDFMNMVENDKPTWVLTVPDEDNARLTAILNDGYTLQFGNEFINYYRVK